MAVLLSSVINNIELKLYKGIMNEHCDNEEELHSFTHCVYDGLLRRFRFKALNQ